MRLTLESTVSEPQHSCKTTIEVPYDDVTLEEVQELLNQLLRGFGFYIPLIKNDEE
mgnify:CR=1